MRFLLDENVEYRLALFLRQRGHDVAAVAHDYPNALADRDVLALARSDGRVLITNDRDVGELIVREGLAHAGVIYLRLIDQDIQTKFARLEHLLANYAEHLNQLVVVDESSVRVRRESWATV